jgi:hypothetical protein
MALLKIVICLFLFASILWAVSFLPSITPSLCYFLFFLVVLGFELAGRQELYSLNHTPSPFVALSLFFFLGGVSCFFSGLALEDPPSYASPVAGMIGAHHHTWLIC